MMPIHRPAKYGQHRSLARMALPFCLGLPFLGLLFGFFLLGPKLPSQKAGGHQRTALVKGPRLRYGEVSEVNYMFISVRDDNTTKSSVRTCGTRLNYGWQQQQQYPPRQNKIVSAVIYNNEEDLLYVRFLETYNVVDLFVVIEAPLTFQGTEKPLNFHREVCGRFAPFASKIVHVVINLQPNRAGQDPEQQSWKREEVSRNALKLATAALSLMPNDLLILSDTDEIPTAAAIQESAFYLWNRIPEDNITVPVVMFECRGFYYSLYHFTGGAGGIKIVPYWASFICSFQDIRSRCFQQKVVYQPKNAGLHASYFFPPEGIANKLKSFSHTELNKEPYINPTFISQRIKENKCIWRDDEYHWNDPATDEAVLAFSPEARQVLLAHSRELRRLQEMV